MRMTSSRLIACSMIVTVMVLVVSLRGAVAASPASGWLASVGLH